MKDELVTTLKVINYRSEVLDTVTAIKLPRQGTIEDFNINKEAIEKNILDEAMNIIERYPELKDTTTCRIRYEEGMFTISRMYLHILNKKYNAQCTFRVGLIGSIDYDLREIYGSVVIACNKIIKYIKQKEREMGNIGKPLSKKDKILILANQVLREEYGDYEKTFEFDIVGIEGETNLKIQSVEYTL